MHLPSFRRVGPICIGSGNSPGGSCLSSNSLEGAGEKKNKTCCWETGANRKGSCWSRGFSSSLIYLGGQIHHCLQVDQVEPCGPWEPLTCRSWIYLLTKVDLGSYQQLWCGSQRRNRLPIVWLVSKIRALWNICVNISRNSGKEQSIKK